MLGMKNAQHCCSTRFAAMLRDELHVFVARITVALLIVYCKAGFTCYVLSQCAM